MGFPAFVGVRSSSPTFVVRRGTSLDQPKQDREGGLNRFDRARAHRFLGVQPPDQQGPGLWEANSRS